MINLPVNPNYCATVVALDRFVTLPNCDNVKHAIIYGACVVVGKDEQAGALGLFFPVETALSSEFMYRNNLYRDPLANHEPAFKSGFFEPHGRVKCMRFRGNKSEGFWIPLSSLKYTGVNLADLPVGVRFDTIEVEETGTTRQCELAVTTQTENIKHEDSVLPAMTRGSAPSILSTPKQTKTEAVDGLSPLLAGHGTKSTIESEKLRSTQIQNALRNSVDIGMGSNTGNTELPKSCSNSSFNDNMVCVPSVDNQNQSLLSTTATLPGRFAGYCATAATSISGNGKSPSTSETPSPTSGNLRSYPICHKYVSRRNLGRKSSNQAPREKAADRLLSGQFAFHYDTPKLAWHADLIKPDTIITITDKWHGTSAVFGRLLAARQLSWWEKALNRLGVPILEVQYEDVWASRKVIKGVGASVTDKLGYYGEDVWEYVFKTWAKDKIPDGYTVYGEIVGYTPSGAAIQSFGGKAWAYGCVPGNRRFMVYRVTFTGPNSAPRDLTWLQMVDFCIRQGFETVELIYHGPAWAWTGDDNFDIFKDIDATVQGRKCRHNPGFPAEGIVVTIEDGALVRQGYKCKSFDFLEQETKALDKGEENMEDSGEELCETN